MGKSRKNLGEGFAGQLSRSRGDKIYIGMRQQQADQFFPGVTGSAHYGHFRFRHNECVFRLGRIATNFLVTIKTFRVQAFSVTS